MTILVLPHKIVYQCYTNNVISISYKLYYVITVINYWEARGGGQVNFNPYKNGGGGAGRGGNLLSHAK